MSNSTVTLNAAARFGYGGKQFVARITGRHPKFTFAYDFMGKKEGKRGESTNVMIDDPGIYITRDVDSKGRADDSFALVYAVDGELRMLWIAREFAMKLGKALDSGAPPDWTAEGLAAEARKVARLAKEKAEEEAKFLETLRAKTEELCAFAAETPEKDFSVNYLLQRLSPGTHYVRADLLLPLYEAELARLVGDAPVAPPIDRTALEAERAACVARIAEIEALLSAKNG